MVRMFGPSRLSENPSMDPLRRLAKRCRYLEFSQIRASPRLNPVAHDRCLLSDTLLPGLRRMVCPVRADGRDIQW